MIKRNYRTDEEWLTLIQECRASGLADKLKNMASAPATSIIKSERRKRTHSYTKEKIGTRRTVRSTSRSRNPMRCS